MDFSIVTEHVESRDGTSIGYLRQGTGPGIVLVQGAMADVHAYRDLALALSSSFTVITAERRGRGISPRPYTADHTITRDIEDLDAVMTATGATKLFGLSSGAVIALEAARTLPNVEQLAVYEPPFYRDGIDRDGIRRLNVEIERGQAGAALIDALVIAGTAPALIARAPRLVARVLGRVILAIQSRQPGPASSLRDLLPGVRYDFHDVTERDGHIQDHASIDCAVLLLSGTASPTFLRTAIRDLAGIIPDSRHTEFDRLGHDGPWNSGGPAQISAALHAFFTL
ncbi:alpha/beta fold hydrolase [Frigoribacterium sp. VKM Ac-2836]|uniref:alpha/beta fold hydrolase n=1 Tax=Frigoribacterium sp. VKM Ac-2836 TaxID=2739014 RepID=UPI001566703F|nr:alpha/beta hydrolase [Frigoribacterium sp. VKM Ac-2836]NRD27949.1 alpha/beta hydrolase [Frigoribacterium sp. VKM Ac-2836]